MRVELLKALIHWIEVVTSVVTYMADDVPEDMRLDLHSARHSLVSKIKEILKEMGS
jgi:hypothetical protein